MENVKRKGTPPVRQEGRCGTIVQVDIPQQATATTGIRHRHAKIATNKQPKQSVVIRVKSGKKVILVQTKGSSGHRFSSMRADTGRFLAKKPTYALDILKHWLSEQFKDNTAPLGKHIATLKPFKNGGSQAIRLPASEAAGVVGWEVEKLEDGRLILEPIKEKKSAADLLRRFAALKVDLFPEGREAMAFPEREW